MADYPGQPGGGRIAATFNQDDSARYATLDEAREAARLSIPSVLPPKDWNETMRLPRNFQSLGSRGCSYIVGKALLATFAPDRPWIIQELAEDILYDPAIPDDRKIDAADILFMQDSLILATLESANYTHTQGDMLGFWTIQRQALTQIFVTGDLLQRLDSEYRLTNFRRDRYVTKRSDSGAVCYHVTVEGKDPLGMTDEQLAGCELKYDDLKEMPYNERCKPLYTKIEWNPRIKKWVVEQEFYGHPLGEPSEEPITNHFSIPYDLAPGANYGRGLPESILGDLAAFDRLCLHTLNFAAAGAKHHPVMDDRSSLQPEDLEQEPGTVLVDRVAENGKPAYLAMLQCGSLNDFQIVHLAKEQLRADLGKSLGGVSEAVRQSERTTAFEVSEVTLAEATGSLGGFLAPVQDKMQLPLFYRTRHQLQKANRLPTLPDEAIKVRVLSGIQALAAQARAGKILKFAEVAKQLDPDGVYLNQDVLLDVLQRKSGIYEPGMIRTPAQRAAIRQRAMQEQAQMQAAEQAIKTTGNVVEQQAGATANGRPSS